MSIKSVSNSSLVYGLSGTRFINELEKHLDDYSRGEAYLSKSTSAELQRQAISSSTGLSPKSLALYSSYSTGFTYTSKSYLTHAVYDIHKAVRLIEDAPKNAEENTAKIKKSLGYA
jgi:hypothetical protein